MAAVEAHQRMLAEMLIESRAVFVGDRLSAAHHDHSPVVLEIAEAQRREIGIDQPRKFLQHVAHETCAAAIVR